MCSVDFLILWPKLHAWTQGRYSTLFLKVNAPRGHHILFGRTIVRNSTAFVCARPGLKPANHNEAYGVYRFHAQASALFWHALARAVIRAVACTLTARWHAPLGTFPARSAATVSPPN